MRSSMSLEFMKQQFGRVKHVANLPTWEGNFFESTNLYISRSISSKLNLHHRLYTNGNYGFNFNSYDMHVPKCHYRTLNPDFNPKTIFSVSSGHGKCGVAVIRVSGSKVKDILTKMVPAGVQTPYRKAVLTRILDPEHKQPIDKGLVLYFPGPYSFTGEDCLEFQVHGGPAVISSLLAGLHKIPDCMQAEPGQFTKRAFLNGKLDLTEVEGLGDLIHAETEVQRKQALRQMDGDLSDLYSQWRSTIIKCVADLEAFIDFSDDQQIEEGVVNTVIDMVNQLKGAIRCHVDDKRQGERLREGVHVTILGEPNVGKSSLLNSLCQRPVAIVTEIAGTTRDVIETAINLDGYPLLISDTAGLRETKDIVEKEGVIRAVKRARHSDIRVFMFDCKKHVFGRDENLNCLNVRSRVMTLVRDLLEDENISEPWTSDGESDQHSDRVDEIKLESDNTIIVLNKTDLLSSDIIKTFYKDFEELNNDNNHGSRDLSPNEIGNNEVTGSETNDLLSDSNNNNKSAIDTSATSCIPYKDGGLSVCCLSCHTGEGLGEFIQVLTNKVANMCGNPLAGHPSLTQTRHRSHLIKCLENLDQFDHMITADDVVLASEYLRRALREIGKITGNISSEEILDVIFKDFCIGK